MGPAHRQTPTIDQVRSGETAALERAAAGFRDALAAERVHTAVLSEDGLLRFKAVAPVGAGSPGPLEPDAVSGIGEAIATGTVRDVEGARPPFDGPGRVVAIPWTAAGEVFGVGVVVMPADAELPADAVLALLGAKVGSTIAALRDCDALVHRVAQLHDSADLLDRVIDSASDAMKLIDLEGRILRWNKAAEEMYGWPEAEVLGEKMPHVPETLRLRAIHDIRAIAASGRAVTRESIAERRDGKRLNVEITVVPYLDGEGHPAGVLSVGREVRGADPGLDESGMCGMLADGLAAPMASLVGYAQLLLHADIIDDPTRRKRTVRAIEEHTATVTSMMDDVALISDAGGPRLLDLELSDVTTLVTDAVGRFEQESPESYRFVVDYDSRVPQLPLDRRRMSRAMASILATTLDGRPEGTECVISIVPLVEGACIEVSVGDAGPGGLTPSRYGTLGLHIARVIVESHGGTLTPGDRDAGVAFRIVLPGSEG